MLIGVNAYVSLFAMSHFFSKTEPKKKKNSETQNAGTQYKGPKESVVKLDHICGQ